MVTVFTQPPTPSVIPANAGIHLLPLTSTHHRQNTLQRLRQVLDSRIHGNDDKRKVGTYILAIALILCTTIPAHATTTQIDPRFCQALVKHVPSADVTYQPGVDVRGKAVTPADLADSPLIKLPDVVTIPLTADLLTMLKLSSTGLPFKTGADTAVNLGNLTLEGDKVMYNGQPLNGTQQDNLSVLCMQPDGRALPPPLDLRPQTP